MDEKEGIQLKSGQQLFIACDNTLVPSDGNSLQCTYRDLPKIVKPNDIIYIDDGKIVCLITDCEHVSISDL